MSVQADYKDHWDEKFKTRAWGRYPPEDLVRFMGRNYKTDPSAVSVLEVGCGTGANLWFLHREGYRVSGIDGSSTGVDIARQRLETENAGLNTVQSDLRSGDFSNLPWDDQSFDVVIDIFAIYANTLAVIEQTVSEVHRVLKHGGVVYSKLWGRECTGYGQGIKIEDGTYDEIPVGPCADMGVTHFFDRPEIERVFNDFEIVAVDRLTRTDEFRGSDMIEEYHCQFRKPE